MLPIFSSRPEVFQPKDRRAVSDACQSLYKLDTPLKLNALKRFSDNVRKGVFSTLARMADDGDGITTANAKDIRRILIFRYDAIGDYIVTSPFISWVREMLPDAEIDVVGSFRNASVLKRDPNFSEVTPIHPRHGYHPSWHRVRQLGKRKHYDVVAALVFTRMTKAAILALAAGRHAMRVTMKHRERESIYGKVFGVQVEHKMGVNHWMETMADVGPTMLGTPRSAPNPYVVVDDNALRSLRIRLVQYEVQHKLESVKGLVPARDSTMSFDQGELEGSPYIVFNVSAYSPNRQWSPERAVAAACGVADALPGTLCFITGGPESYEAIDKAVDKAGHSKVYFWSGTLLELIPLIAGSRAVVTPDTAALHIAATTKRPVVGLYAELIKVAEWFPYGTEYRALLSPDPTTINALPVSLIVDAVQQLTS